MSRSISSWLWTVNVCRLFSLTPNRPERGPGPAQEYMADESERRRGFEGPFPVKAGPHTVAAAFLKRSGLPETARQPFKADYNGRSLAAIFSVSVAGPYNPGAPGRTPSRQRIFVCQPSKPSAELGCAKTIIERLARRAYRRQLADADREKLLKYYREGRAEGGTFEQGIEMAAPGDSGEPGFPVPHRARSRPSSPAAGVSAQRCRAGVASLVLPLEQHSRRSVARSGDWRQASESARFSSSRFGVCWRTSGRTALVDNFAEQWLYLRNLAAVSSRSQAVSGL